MQNKMLDDQLFKAGDSVEVSPDDIGLSGSWYEATILSNPQTPKTPKSKSNPKKRNPNSQIYYNVEYKNLLDDIDETKLLYEKVSAANIRPLPPPPPPDHRFQLNDVVEAFHRDGWWVGVITEVLEDFGSFRVNFSYPPDQIQCGASDLRVHLEWVDGTWVQPKVHTDNQLEIGERSLKKKRESSHPELAGDDVSKNGSRLAIQTPPSSKRKVLESGYQIKMCSSTKQRKSITISSFDDDPTNGEKEKDSKEVEGSKEVCSNITEVNDSLVTLAHVAKQLEIEKKSSKKKKERSGPELAEDGAIKKGSRHVTQTPLFKKRKELESCDQVKTRSSTKRGKSMAVLSLDDDPTNEEIGKGYKEVDHSKEVCDNITEDGIQQNHTNSLSNTRSRSESTHSVHDSGRSPNRNVQGLNDSLNESEVDKDTYDRTVSVELAGVGNGTTLLNSNQESIIGEKAVVIEFYGYKFRNPSEELGTVNEEAPILDQATVVEGHNKSVSPTQEIAIVEEVVDDCNDLKLPFKKTLDLWNMIESMPVFKSIRQRPHFRGLVDKYPIHCREGKAIGYMLMFRDVVEKTAGCTLDEERESFFEILRTLPKLEKNGFVVERIRNRLNELIESKDEYDRIKGQLIEQNREKEKVVNVIEELDEQIKERQEKCAEAMATKENIECEIAHIELNLLALRQSFEGNVF